jgi:hypothetical protein
MRNSRKRAKKIKIFLNNPENDRLCEVEMEFGFEGPRFFLSFLAENIPFLWLISIIFLLTHFFCYLNFNFIPFLALHTHSQFCRCSADDAFVCAKRAKLFNTKIK